MNFIVGTFNTPSLYTLTFTPPSPSSSKDSTASSSLAITAQHPAIGNHSWLALSPKPKQANSNSNSNSNSTTTRFLYATAWTEPPSIAAYAIHPSPTTSSAGLTITALNNKPVRARSGYVCASSTHVYSVGGPTGEAFALSPDGSVGDLVQELDFVDASESDKPSGALHGDFGGLRHGSHSVDLSPDGRSLFVADIGRNAIFTYAIDNSAAAGKGKQHLTLGEKHISPRSNDGPRHAWPHPNGKVLYVLQEHSTMADAFTIGSDGTTLSHAGGVRIIPADKDEKAFWADEVRLSTGTARPRYLYASTRGLAAETKGYVAVFELDGEGGFKSKDGEAVCIWETPTSGGIANAVEPAPRAVGERSEHQGGESEKVDGGSVEAGGVEYLAMTDSQEGWVFLLSFDGKEIKEVARVSLGKTEGGEVVQAATAVWL